VRARDAEELHSISEGQKGLLFIQRNSNIYIRSRKDNKELEPIWKTGEKQVRTELHNQSTDWAVTRGEKPNAVSPAWKVEGWNQGLMSDLVVL